MKEEMILYIRLQSLKLQKLLKLQYFRKILWYFKLNNNRQKLNAKKTE